MVLVPSKYFDICHFIFRMNDFSWVFSISNLFILLQFLSTLIFRILLVRIGSTGLLRFPDLCLATPLAQWSQCLPSLFLFIERNFGLCRCLWNRRARRTLPVEWNFKYASFTVLTYKKINKFPRLFNLSILLSKTWLIILLGKHS